MAVLSQLILFFALFYVENLFDYFLEVYRIFEELFGYPETYLVIFLSVGIGYLIQVLTYKVCEERTSYAKPKKIDE